MTIKTFQIVPRARKRRKEDNEKGCGRVQGVPQGRVALTPGLNGLSPCTQMASASAHQPKMPRGLKKIACGLDTCDLSASVLAVR